MKSSRRRFIKAGAALASAASLPFTFAKGARPVQTPVVISTWNFGKAANAEAWKVLSANGRALDAVERGVWVPEGDPKVTSVGIGGLPDRDGRVTLDACIMDEFANIGAVACLENIVHPISVARMVMEKTPHVMLAGEGALQFALANGFKKEKLLTAESEKAWKEWLKTANYKPIANIENHDTIGMLALDMNQNLSGACTTSGLAYKMRGRVGDSPIIGAGLFVDNEIGAAVSTGQGEEVIRICGSHLVVELMRQGNSPQEACEKAVMRIVKNQPKKSKDMQVGFLAMDKTGEYGAYALQKGFTFAVYSEIIPNTILEAKSFF